VDACVTTDGLDAALVRTDILVSTAPLTPATRHLVDRRRLELLPRGAGVVLVGRAAVLDCDALAEMLTRGRLGGAVLDVFPEEPLPPGHPLWDCPRLVMTPHCGLDDHARYIDACLDIFCGNLARFAAGEPLVNVVDPARGY
jgi:phosphoglycerate dehydrogenase-like enzyme